MSFPVTWDRTTKFVTAFTLAVLIFAAVGAHSLAVGALCVALALVSWAYSPKGYLLSDRTLTVQRPIGDIRIPLDDVRELRCATSDDLSGCIRLWASGGLFGYYGLFRTSKLGKCTWYVTDRSKCVLVVSPAKTIVLSPNDVDGFLGAIQAAAPIPKTINGEPLFQVVDSGRRYGFVGVTIGALGLAGAFAAMFYAPGAPGYTLTPESLTIHDRFYPVTISPSSVDVSGAKVVDIDLDAQWRPTMRTGGFGNLRYHAGRFRVANGQTVRMYRANAKRLVLLPARGNGSPLLYEVSEPEKFVEEIQREWAGHS